VIGNVIGVSSTLLWLVLLRMGDANVATGLAIGGGFLAQQIAIVLVYKSRLALVQLVGIAAIVGGMLCLGMGGKG
jgi:multidrug transporter EmrE-like cation transporter